MRLEVRDTGEKLVTAQAERDSFAMRVEELAAAHGVPAGLDSAQAEVGVIQGHLRRIADLEAEVKHLKQVNSPLAHRQDAVGVGSVGLARQLDFSASIYIAWSNIS